MSQHVHLWNSADGELTLERIESLHVPSTQFRICRQSYKMGTEFGGAARSQRLYVLEGACRYTVGETTWQMNAQCYADLPAGEFQFRVTSEEDIYLVHVWALPTHIQTSEQPES